MLNPTPIDPPPDHISGYRPELIYASSSRIGFTNATDRQKIQASVFVILNSMDLSDFNALCAKADNELFQKILNSPDHVLHPLLPPSVGQKYNLRSRPHNRHLPECTSHLIDCNFMVHVISSFYFMSLHFTSTIRNCTTTNLSLFNVGCQSSFKGKFDCGRILQMSVQLQENGLQSFDDDYL